jgi:hypothetical protein
MRASVCLGRAYTALLDEGSGKAVSVTIQSTVYRAHCEPATQRKDEDGSRSIPWPHGVPRSGRATSAMQAESGCPRVSEGLELLIGREPGQAGIKITEPGTPA